MGTTESMPSSKLVSMSYSVMTQHAIITRSHIRRYGGASGLRFSSAVGVVANHDTKTRAQCSQRYMHFVVEYRYSLSHFPRPTK